MELAWSEPSNEMNEHREELESIDCDLGVGQVTRNEEMKFL